MLFAAYTALGMAWIVGNPPFASPDEEAHYLRAVGLSTGDLIGDPTRFPGAANDPRLTFVNKFSRSISVPAGLSPAGSGCNIAQATESSVCLYAMNPPRQETTARTYAGIYAPTAYLLPSLLLRRADNPNTANRLARLGVAIPSALFLAIAIFLLWAPTPYGWSLLGLVVALTPMTVFMSATMNPNGLEIASSIAFLAAVLRFARALDPPTWVWPAAGASGAVLAFSRTLGPLWVGLGVAIAVSLVGVRGTWTRVRARPIPAMVAAAAIAVGVVLNLAWEAAHGADVNVALRPLQRGVSEGFTTLPSVLTQEIGAFGYLEVTMPTPAYLAWWGCVLAIITLALVVAEGRERFTLVAGLVASVLIPVALYAAVFRPTGYGVQGRYVLPFAVAVPLLAGEIVFRHRDRLEALNTRRLLGWLAAIAAVVHAVAWLANSRRYATGVDGPWWFFGRAEWSPPLGWWPWALLAGGGSLLLFLAGALDPESRWRLRRERTGGSP
jgi:hypothetical protein